MKVAVVGPGGVGGYFGGRLAAAGEDIHLIARGAHLDAIRANGLRIESPLGDATVHPPATEDPDEVGECDAVLVTVKSYDTESVAGSLDGLLREGTAVVSLQNGVDNEAVLADAVGEAHVLGGVAYIFAGIREPGVIAHTGGPARVVFGELDGRRSERATRLLAAFEGAGVDAELSDRIRGELWEKAAFICAQAGLTAATRLPIGELRDDDAAWGMYRDVVEEAVRVAEADGIDLPDGLVDRWLGFARDLEADAYSSLHDDMVAGRRMELEALHGAVLRRAADAGVAVPMTRAIYAILRPWAARNGTAVQSS